MELFTNIKALTRGISIIAAVLVVASGVTFAALQSQPGILQGNTIQTAIASLQVSPNGTTYSSTMQGYGFGNLIPGGQPTPTNGYPVYIKNVGTTPLALKLSISSPVANPDNVDLNKVHVILSSTSGGTPQNVTLQDLITAHNSGGLSVNQAPHVIPTQVVGYVIQISMDADAMTGSTASLSNIDFNFGALAVS